MPVDKLEQYDQIQTGLMPGEHILAVYDAIGAGTGFIGLTNRRVVIQDKSFVGKKVAITSIPYARITSVSMVSNKSWAGSFFSPGCQGLVRPAVLTDSPPGARVDLPDDDRQARCGTVALSDRQDLRRKDFLQDRVRAVALAGQHRTNGELLPAP
jgi:hypothetical protein